MFSIKTNILLSVMGTGVEFIAFGYCLFLLWTHTITYGTMTLFLQQRSNLSGAFNNVVSIIPSFLNSSVSAHRIRELVELPKEVHISESEELDPFAEDGFEVLMKDVNFAYVEGTRVITDSYFKACPGEIVALVGPSGEGKDDDDPSDPWTDPSAGRRGCERCIQRQIDRPECGDETFLRLCTSGKYDPFRYDC